MYFENNKKINSDLTQQLGTVRRQNIDLNNQIQSCKRNILDMV